MSETATPRTPMAPPLPPQGFPLGYARYRNYVLFACTSIFMFIGAAVLLLGVRALANGPEAWARYLDGLGQPVALVLSAVVLAFSLYFVIRWSWIGRKIGVGRVGPVPRNPLPMPVIGIAPIVLFALVWVVVLMVLGGALA